MYFAWSSPCGRCEMAPVSISQGWKSFLRAAATVRVSDATEWMWRLNLFARASGRHPVVDQIYTLKNALIRYLYEGGYCVEATKTFQKRMCYSCDGTGVFWTGDECLKCEGSGVYAVTPLYAFRFMVGGRRYSWHQLEKLVDYPVTLTDHTPQEYQEPTRAEDVLSLESA